MSLGLRGRRWPRWIALGGLLLLVAAGGAAAYVLTNEPGDVSNADVEFTEEQPTATQPLAREPASTEHPMDDDFRWPQYGDNAQRTRAIETRTPLRPPFERQWSVTGRILLEFPPVLCRRSLYLQKNNSAIYKISRLTGKVQWKEKVGYLAASSPACDDDRVYAVVLQREKGVRAGSVVALDTKDGRVLWSRRLPSRVESSPLLADGRLYFGSEDGTVYALRASDGAIRWRTRVGGAVKGGLALDRGRLFFGDYAGKVHALRQSDGSRLWQTSGAGSAFGLRSGRFYGTPAVAYGRVYLGSLDGFVYSFAASSGRLAWRHRTGNYVYSSPAVATVPGLGPTVYVGSYDGRLYAFDARSGSVRWSHAAGGKISGGPVVIGDLVLYSNLSRRSSAALGVATGKVVWSTDRGAFNPAISDGKRLYFVGYSSLFMLSSRAQARRDEAARQRLADRAGHGAARRQRTANASRARAERSHRRAVARRVAARRAAVRRNRALRRAGREVCFRRDGRTVCRVPRPLVCFKRGEDGRTVCRARRKG